MKKVSKTVVAFLIFLMVALVFSASLPEKTRAAYPPEGETALFADPDFIDVSGASRPATYSFDVKIQNKAGVVTIAFDLAFDPNIVEILSITPNPNNELPGGSFLIGDDPTTPNVIEMITYGILGAWWDITTPKSAVRITVKLKDFTPPTGTKLDITNMDCYDKEGYNFLTGDCPYDNIAIMPPVIVVIQPKAEFTWSPLMPAAGETVTFDASDSTGGYDGSQACPITEYRWDWESDGVFDDIVSTPVITHVFTESGLYDVTLEVFAPPGPSPDPSYVPTARITKSIYVKVPAKYRIIDLYTQDTRHPGYTTQFTGEGIDSSVDVPPADRQVDSYAPQDLVILYAKVTYNGAPVANKEVAFEIHGPENPYHNITIYRQAFTNESGIAQVDFRIPWPDEHAEDIVFGNWTIMAKVDIAEMWVMDWHWFYVHWIIDIESVTVTPFELVRGIDTATINVTVHNWAKTPRNATITAVIYDELGVPVGAATTTVTVGGETSISVSLTIFIPKWAYVGEGIAYVNAFTKLPWECGVCWCPEASARLYIKAS